jgi:hypothetical protein
MYTKKKDREQDKPNKRQSVKDIYPISVHKQQCIGPCYYSDSRIIHPLTLEEIKGVEHNFCPTNTFVFTDPKTKKNQLSIIDKCIVPTARETRMDDILRDFVIVPQLYFSSDYFVKVYYKIYSLEEFLTWLDSHKTDPFKTKERVFNNCMVVYGDQLNIIDHRIVYFINELMLKNLPRLYRHLNKFFSIKDDTVTLIDLNKYNAIIHNEENKEKDEGDQQDITDDLTFNEKQHTKIALIREYIKEKFLGSDNVQQFMSKIIRYYKEDITDRHISDILVKHMIDYIIKRIKLTLEQEK